MPSPITCLGKSFATEDERRSYFRDELHKKLPELRKIEGFPIGTDDDILNLSDPPYYTACPNPWLNDFIAQWEEEKKDLEKNKKRKADFGVHEPYASDVSEGKNNPIYNAHSYHTKVPHPAIMRYILHYTQPGDVVFDGFAGTGMTGVASQFCAKPDAELKFKIDTEFKQMGLLPPVWGERKAICGDLSPIASLIASNYNSPVNTDEFELEAREILNLLYSECGWMYSTTHSNGKEGRIKYTVWSDILLCSACGGEIIFWDVALDKNTAKIRDEFNCPSCNTIQTKKSTEKAMVTVFDQALNKSTMQQKNVPVLINYEYQGKRYEKSPDQSDYDRLLKIEQTPVPYWFPSNPMMGIGTGWGDTWRAGYHKGITNVHHFYTKRANYLYALAFSKAKSNLIKIWLTSSQIRTTKMYKYVPVLNNGKLTDRRTGNISGTLYVPSLSDENCPFDLLESKISDFRSIGVKNKNVVQVASAKQILLADNSIDYIFTDPPFGSNLMYSELNFMWEAWLRVITNNIPEAIENKTQGKSVFEYQEIMFRCFTEYFRLLKPSGWMTVEFSNTSAAVWNGIQAAIQRAGFVIANVAALDKQQGSFKAVTTPTAVKQDLVISCYKPSNEFDKKFQTTSGDINVWAFVEEHLQHLPITITKDQKTTAVIERSPKILYDRLITFYLMRGLPIPIDASEFQTQLKEKFIERDEMIFTTEQAAQYESQKIKQGSTLQLSLVFDIIYSESDAVEWLKARLAKGPQKYQDIQPDFRKANTATRKGEKEFELQTLLNENFIPLTDGRYRVPDMNEAKDREHFRTAALLKEFNKYVEELANPKTKKLKDVRVEALREGFKSAWQKKDFVAIVNVAEKIPQNLLMEDEYLLNFYDIAKDRV